MQRFEECPEEVRDKIFSYLTIQDFKNASLVSKHWYNLIGQSKLCMRKLRINKCDCFEDFESILNSNRQYQHLTLMIEQSELKKNTKYLRVLRDIVEKFSESLLYLKISQDLKLKDDLLKLKELQIVLNNEIRLPVNFIVSNGLITKAINLKKLLIKFHNFDAKSLQYIRDAILMHESLKILEMETHHIIQELNQNDIKLKLYEIHLNYGGKPLKAFEQFFDTQISSLQVIDIPLEKNFINYFISKFPKLHTLIIIFALYSAYEKQMEQENFEYTKNWSIKKLIIKGYFTKENHMFFHACEIIKKFLNLQEIEFEYLNPGMLPHLNDCQSLKIVKYKHLNFKFPQSQNDVMTQHERLKFVQIEH
ncbi:unnamed protein product [Chironomus riparius]|uniref:F-box domain-containing protein n=1 Tax=Chironomus riparius TaxID=315576 RepID=A0A9N9RND4_9DIPT|nr:unnamed protein product [Chironomus riparius]